MRSLSRSQREKIRYAVVGLGHVSQNAVLPAFRMARERCELKALVSSDFKKLESLSEEYCVERTYTYGQYADCLRSGEIDAVYIALPNQMHHAYAKAAAEAGIHVVCDTPMALNEEECRSMIHAAEKARVKLMIAYRSHFEAGSRYAIGAIRSERIGDPRIFTAALSQKAKTRSSRPHKSVCGRALYDLGIHCVSAARHLFQSEPREVFAWSASASAREAGFREVPEMTCGVMKFPNDRFASFTCSFGSADHAAYEMIGTKGVLRMSPAGDMAGYLKSDITVGARTATKTFSQRDPFAPELAYFSNCILANEDPEPSAREGLADVRIIQALLQSSETHRPVCMEQVKADRFETAWRPNLDREISRLLALPSPQFIRALPPAAD